YVPEITRIQNPYAGAGPVTLIQLATHTSGLTGIDPLLPPGARLEWGQALVSVLPQVRFDSEPGTRYQYSNVGYAILGLALERAAAQPYLDYLSSQIFVPLGMADTAYYLTPEMASRSAKGYRLQDGAPVVARDPTRPEQMRGDFLLP